MQHEIDPLRRVVPTAAAIAAVNVLSLAVCHGKPAVYSDPAAKVRHSRLVKEAAESG